VLLQVGLPGFLELAVLNVLVAALVGYLTYRDAGNRGANAPLWGGVVAAASLFLSLVGFLVVFAVYYLLVVRE
jgi:hypothetical protein